MFGQNSTQTINYQVTITLSSDGSRHIGIAPNLTLAKQRAAMHALAHLKPKLEQFRQASELEGCEHQLTKNEQRELTNRRQDQLSSHDMQIANSDTSSPSTLNSESPDSDNKGF